jgi:hypothetical protein
MELNACHRRRTRLASRVHTPCAAVLMPSLLPGALLQHGQVG